MKKHKVFLGGTCNNSKWRNELMPYLRIDYFNPVVDNWTPDCQQIEIEQKEKDCNIHLYVITKEMIGVFSIAEAIDSVHDIKKDTIFHVMPNGFSKAQLKSLRAVGDLVKRRGGISFISDSLTETIQLLNQYNA